VKRCAKGHEYAGDENYRARTGRCPHCFKITQHRYDLTDKGRERRIRYNHSEKGEVRNANYMQSPKGWLLALRNRHRRALTRRADRATN
jgi:hypothetical protein